MKYEKLWRYLFNQFFCGNLDRLGGNMSDLMEEALSHNITHLTREREHKSIFWPKDLWEKAMELDLCKYKFLELE